MRALSKLTVLLAAISCVGATPALAATMTPVALFRYANIPIKLMMVGLVIAMLVAVVVTVRKVREGHISGGSTYLASLRFGGPLLGLLGAALDALWTLIGISSAEPDVPFQAFAPRLAEAMLVMSLGILSGVVAVLCHWVVEARVDRLVLKV